MIIGTEYMWNQVGASLLMVSICYCVYLGSKVFFRINQGLKRPVHITNHYSYDNCNIEKIDER